MCTWDLSQGDQLTEFLVHCLTSVCTPPAARRPPNRIWTEGGAKKIAGRKTSGTTAVTGLGGGGGEDRISSSRRAGAAQRSREVGFLIPPYSFAGEGSQTKEGIGNAKRHGWKWDWVIKDEGSRGTCRVVGFDHRNSNGFRVRPKALAEANGTDSTDGEFVVVVIPDQTISGLAVYLTDNKAEEMFLFPSPPCPPPSPLQPNGTSKQGSCKTFSITQPIHQNEETGR